MNSRRFVWVKLFVIALSINNHELNCSQGAMLGSIALNDEFLASVKNTNSVYKDVK